MIYFVACPTTNAVKIGFAQDPWKRFSKIQSDTPNILELLAVESGDLQRERQLHRQFAEHWRRGEWFELSTPIREYVATLPAPIKPRQRKPLGGALGAWINDQELTLREVAAMVGCSAGAICMFCAGKQIPRKAIMRRIYSLTQGAVRPDHFYDLPPLAATDAEAA